MTRPVALGALMVAACTVSADLDGVLCDDGADGGQRCGEGYACVVATDGGAARCRRGGAGGGTAGGGSGGGTAGGAAGGIDAGPMDAGPMDAGPMDAGPMDAGPVDAGPVFDGGFPVLVQFRSAGPFNPVAMVLIAGRFRGALYPDDVMAWTAAGPPTIVEPDTGSSGYAINMPSQLPDRAGTLRETGAVFDSIFVSGGNQHGVYTTDGGSFAGVTAATENVAGAADLDGLLGVDLVSASNGTVATRLSPTYSDPAAVGASLNCACSISAFPRRGGSTGVVVGSQNAIFVYASDGGAGLSPKATFDGGHPVWAISTPAGDFIAFNVSGALQLRAGTGPLLSLTLSDAGVVPAATALVPETFRAGDGKPEFSAAVVISSIVYGLLASASGATLYPVYDAAEVVNAIALGEFSGDGGTDVAVAHGMNVKFLLGGAP